MRWLATGGILRSTKGCCCRTESNSHTESRSSIKRPNCPAKCRRSQDKAARDQLFGCCYPPRITVSKTNSHTQFMWMGIFLVVASRVLFAVRLGWEVLKQLVHHFVQVLDVLVRVIGDAVGR